MAYKFNMSFLILITGIILSLIAGSKNPFLIAAPFVLLITLYILANNKIRSETVTSYMLIGTLVVQSITFKGVNISLSDIYLFFIAFIILLKKDIIELPKTYTLIASAYLSFTFISIFWSSNIGNAIPQIIQFFEFMIIGTVLFYNIRKIEIIKHSLNLYVIGTVIISIVSILYVMTNGISANLYILGLHKNYLGTILGNSLPILVGLIMLNKNMPWYILCFFLNSSVLVLSGSRGSMLGAIAGIFFTLIFAKKIKTTLIFTISLVLATLLLIQVLPTEYKEGFVRTDKFSSAYSRVIIFNDAIQKIKEEPILGHGLGSYFIHIPQINFSQDDPNNIFLRSLVEGGIVGTFLFALLLLYIFIRAFKNIRLFSNQKDFMIISSMAFGGFVSQLTHNQVDVSWLRGSGLFMFSMVGIILVLRKIK